MVSATALSVCLNVVLIVLLLRSSIAFEKILPSFAGRGSTEVVSLETTATAESTGISSTTGRKWKAHVIRTYAGPRLNFAELSLNRRAFAPLPNQRGQKCTNWAVITTIFSPTETASQLDNLPAWCAVFVGDKKSPPKKEWTDKFPPQTSRVHFLDVTDQEALPYWLKAQTPWNHFSRKNLGFLYAIHLGARVIYDTDDDNVLTENGRTMTEWASELNSTSTLTHSVWRSRNNLCNPYVDFNVTFKYSGQSTFVWPRGFPLEYIRDLETYVQNTSLPLQSVASAQIGVVQALANHDPDVDGIYRLTQKLPLRFVSKKRLVVLAEGTLAPYNAQATLHSYQALWALLLPASVHGRISDIWRSLIFQRIMWQTGARLAFAAPFVDQFRNAHDYLADFDSELPLYLQAGALSRFLLSWAAAGLNSVPELMEALFIALFEIGLVDVSDVALCQAWISDLFALGYAFPPITHEYKPIQMQDSKIVDGRHDGGGS